MQLESSGNLVRVGSSITQGGVDLRAAQQPLFNYRRNRVVFRLRRVVHPHSHLPNVRAAQKPGPPSRRPITEGNQGMLLVSGALLCVAPKAVRERLASSSCPDPQSVGQCVVESDGDIYRHVGIVAQCLQTFACALGGADGRTLFMVAAEWPLPQDASGRLRTGQVLSVEVATPAAASRLALLV